MTAIPAVIGKSVLMREAERAFAGFTLIKGMTT